MELGTLKPLITMLVLPLASLLLLALTGLVLMVKRKRVNLGMVLVGLAVSTLWVLSCPVTAAWLGRTALPQYAPLTVAQLKAQRVQAIVVLGGGLFPEAPEYGEAQPGPATAARLRYGIWLSKQSGLPIAFTGGLGWSIKDTLPNGHTTEAAVAARVALQDYGVSLRWLETQSRDTAENARLTAPLLQRDGVQRIALVTDAWHLPRAIVAFERTGLIITPAPMGYLLATQSGALLWLPSVGGLSTSTRVLQELLGLLVARLTAA